jgi:hypothetical protein
MIPIRYKSARSSTADTQTSERRVNARCLTCEDCWELEADRTVKDGIWAANVYFFEGGLVQIPKRGGGRVERRLRRDAIAESLLEYVELPPYVCTVRKGLRRINFIHPLVDDAMQILSTHYLIFSPSSMWSPPSEPSWTWRCVGVIWLCLYRREICQANMKDLENHKAWDIPRFITWNFKMGCKWSMWAQAIWFSGLESVCWFHGLPKLFKWSSNLAEKKLPKDL